MRNMLLVTVAAAGLALAGPATAQDLPNAVPATPPITAETPLDPDAALTGAAEANVQTPEGSVRAETQAEAEAQASAETPAEAAQSAAAMAASPAEPNAAIAGGTAASASARTPPAPIPASASAVCQPRVTSVHFGARGSALSQQNRNALEHAVDAASVCNLQQVQIVDSASGATSTRRASAVRTTLIAQGVPEDRIVVAQEANADAEASSTGRLDVRISFAGVAAATTPTANTTAPTETPTTMPESGS